MRAKNRAMARKQLDKRLNSIREGNFARPPYGWIKAIRQALGMTTSQLARRIGVVQSRVVGIEKAESTGSITLDSLQRAAHALDCELIYALVPRNPLETIIEERSMALARRRIKNIRHTMALENQELDEEDESEQIKQLARKFTESSSSKLWEDE